jgi:glycosyltransferase involved in cell wall biosynthesis
LSVHLDHVGTEAKDKRYATRIRRLTDKLGLQDTVTFHGGVAESRLRELFRSSNAFIFPNAPQTWGLSVFEAMASGLPVVLTDGCGASEILANRTNALIVPQRDPAALAAAIEELISDGPLCERLSQEGRKFVERELGWSKYASAMVAAFSDATSHSQQHRDVARRSVHDSGDRLTAK